LQGHTPLWWTHSAGTPSRVFRISGRDWVTRRGVPSARAYVLTGLTGTRLTDEQEEAQAQPQ